MSNNNALNGAKARIVTLSNRIIQIEDENTELRHLNAVSDRRYNTMKAELIEAYDGRQAAQVAAAELRYKVGQLTRKVEQARIIAVTLGIALIITIGTITGGLLA